MNKTDVYCPISGVLLSISEVPDPVFSSAMMGPGFAIAPSAETLYSPFEGKVIHIHPHLHAMTLRSTENESNQEILLHVGVDTVQMKGDGFCSFVQEGDHVKTGQKLLSFDLKKINDQAPSSQVIFVWLNSNLKDSESLSFYREMQSFVKNGDLVTKIGLSSASSGSIATDLKDPKDHEDYIETEVTITLPSGLHARPAARLVQWAKSNSASVDIIKNGRTTQVSSVLSLMAMELSFNDIVQIKVYGPEKESHIEGFLNQLNEIEKLEIQAKSIDDRSNPESTTKLLDENKVGVTSQSEEQIRGKTISPGWAIGPLFILGEEEDWSTQIPDRMELPQDDIPSEVQYFESALLTAKDQLIRLSQGDSADEKKISSLEIFSVQAEMLSDPMLRGETIKGIQKGFAAVSVWKNVFQNQAAVLAQKKNELFAARAKDIQDVGKRVLSILIDGRKDLFSKMGLQKNKDIKDEIPENCIVLARELSPSQTAEFSKRKVQGFCTREGGSTSHVAILARSLGLPAMVGIGEEAFLFKSGTLVLLNAVDSYLKPHPTEDEIKRITDKKIAQTQSDEMLKKKAQSFALTRDGKRIEVAANISREEEVPRAIEYGAEAMGLFRTEFLFLDRDSPPTEDEQFQVYFEMAKKLTNQRKMILRTLDVGGDKPLKYSPIEKEENPFLGVRGIRFSFQERELFCVQLRAMLRVHQEAVKASSYLAPLYVMFPMVSELNEFIQAKSIVQELCDDLKVTLPKLGMMVEVPAAALQAEVFAREVDFFSIGTNDLTQYTLAVDRGHHQISHKADALHPSVLRLMKMTSEAAKKNNIWTGICGGIASDVEALPLLIGLGLDELSVSIPSIPAIKEKISNLSSKECCDIAQKALLMSTSEEVRALLKV